MEIIETPANVLNYLGFGMLILGVLVFTAFAYRILILAFETHLWWGLFALILPPVLIGYVVTHFEKTRSAALVMILTLPVIGAGMWLAGPLLSAGPA